MDKCLVDCVRNSGAFCSSFAEITTKFLMGSLLLKIRGSRTTDLERNGFINVNDAKKETPFFVLIKKKRQKRCVKCHFFPFLGSAPTYHFVNIKKEKKCILNGGTCCYKGTTDFVPTTAVSALDGSVIT